MPSVPSDLPNNLASDGVTDADVSFMRLALTQAQQAAELGEVPVGAVLVKADEVIATAFNQPIALNDPTAHAEVQVLRAAGERLGNYRLTECTLYVTLEPCVMCVGAMIHARLARLVYGAPEPKMGAVHSAFDLLQSEQHYHRMEVTSGVLEEECRTRIQTFFKQRRADKKRTSS